VARDRVALADRALRGRAVTPRAAWGLAAVLALAGAAYAPFLAIDFLCDDWVMLGVYLWDGADVTAAQALRNFFPDWYGGRDFYRPWILLSALPDWLFFRTDATGYHLQNLLLHGLVTAGVFALARRLTGRDAAGIAAAVFFGLSPIHPESILWVVGRCDLWPTLFLVLTLLLFLRFRATGRRRFLAAAWGGMALALLSKETAITFPAVVLAADVSCPRRPARALFAVHAPFWLLLAGYFLLRHAAFGAFLGRYEQDGPSILEFFVRGLPYLPRDGPRFLGAMIAPASAAAFPDGRGLARLLLAAPFAALVLLGVRRGRRPGLAFAAAVFVILAFPEAVLATEGFQPLDPDLLNARMAYLPLVGLSLLLAAWASPKGSGPAAGPDPFVRWIALGVLAAVDFFVLRANAARFVAVDRALHGLREGLVARAGAGPLVLENPPRSLLGVNCYWTGLEQSLDRPFRERATPVLPLDLVSDRGFEDFLYRNAGAPRVVRWDAASGAFAERGTADGFASGWTSWNHEAGAWVTAPGEPDRPSAGTDALHVAISSPVGGEGVLRWEPADPRWPGVARFPLRPGGRRYVVPLRFSRPWLAAGRVRRLALELPDGATPGAAELLPALPPLEALAPADGALQDLEREDPAFAHRARGGVALYRLVLELPERPPVRVVYDAARLLGHEPAEGEEVRRSLADGASLVSGWRLERGALRLDRSGDFVVAWRVEALADPERPSVILGASPRRRLTVRNR
jgi:hypothetical protein